MPHTPQDVRDIRHVHEHLEETQHARVHLELFLLPTKHLLLPRSLLQHVHTEPGAQHAGQPATQARGGGGDIVVVQKKKNKRKTKRLYRRERAAAAVVETADDSRERIAEGGRRHWRMIPVDGGVGV